MERKEQVVKYLDSDYDVITIKLQKSEFGKRIVAMRKCNTNDEWEIRTIKDDGRTKSFIEYNKKMVSNEKMQEYINQLVIEHYNVKTVKLFLNNIKYEAVILTDIYRDLICKELLPKDFLNYTPTNQFEYLKNNFKGANISA